MDGQDRNGYYLDKKWAAFFQFVFVSLTKLEKDDRGSLF